MLLTAEEVLAVNVVVEVYVKMAVPLDTSVLVVVYVAISRYWRSRSGSPCIGLVVADGGAVDVLLTRSLGL